MESTKKMLDLGLVLDIGNYEMSLDRWQKDPQQREKEFDQYLAVIKPLVHRYHRGSYPLTQYSKPSPPINTFSSQINSTKIKSTPLNQFMVYFYVCRVVGTVRYLIKISY